MIKTAGRATPILNYICVVLLFAIFVMQLLPFWSNADAIDTSPTKTEREVSIQQYVWFPENKKTPNSPGNDMTKYFENIYNTFICKECGYENPVKWDDACPECSAKRSAEKYEWEIGEIVLMPVMIVVCCIVTIFFGIRKPNRLWMNIVYLLAGIIGIWGYLSNPIYQRNQMYIVHLLLCDRLILASLANIAFRPWKRIIHFVKTGD